MILSRGGVITRCAGWHLEETGCAIIKEQEVLVVGNRDCVLTNRGQAPGSDSHRVLFERRKLIPGFGWIAEDPLNRTGIVIDGDDKVFSTRDHYRVIRTVISRRIVMKPVRRRGKDK